MAADVGTGATITFGTSAYTAELTDIQWTGIERTVVDITHLGSSQARVFMPGDLYDPGSAQLSVLFDVRTPRPAMNNAAETVTLTFPSSDTAVASGFFSGWEFGVPLEDKMTATVNVKFTGAITFTT
jgi:hypothetical protein